MAPIAKQFDPFLQAEQARVEVDALRASLDAALQRYDFALERCRQENERLRAERDAVEFYSESEFAQMLGIYDEKAERPVQYLANLRKQYRLPHRKIGIKTIYTKSDIAAAMEIFKINGKVEERQFKKAA